MGVWSRLLFLLSASDIAQIQREREVAVRILRRRCEPALLMAVPEKARQAAALGFVAVHGEPCRIHSAGMRDVIRASAERTFVPSVVEVEPQRGVRTDRRLQAMRRLPRAIAHAGDAFAV